MKRPWQGNWLLTLMGFAFLGLVVLPGCDSSGLAIVPVSGVISFDGGPCPTNGTIYFSPIEVAEGSPKRPGMGQFDKDGKFAVTSFRPGDGLVPGRYSVSIECFEGPVNPFNPEAGSFIAQGAQWPELSLESGTSSAVVVNYDIPTKKQ